MKIYLVGGAIRDKLLGIEPKENDWVVVGSEPEELLNLGYKQVGKQFPVFLHPKTSEEHALARVENKINEGHKGFQFDTSKTVTLEEDLQRRDLTVNAIAQGENGELIDPYNGVADIENRLLKHVSDAFLEDPLRVFRVARFYSKLSEYNFKIHDSTYKMMVEIANSGEIETLSKERLWGELSESFNSKNPWMFFEALMKANVAKNYFPEIINNEILKKKIIYFSSKNIEKDIFLSIVGFSIDFVELFGFPKKIMDLYFMFNEFGTKFISLELNNKIILDFLNSLDAFRRPDRLKILLQQVKYFLDFNNKEEKKRLNVFTNLYIAIEDKIDYGKLNNLDVDEIKVNVENINLNLIKLILDKEIK